MFFQKVRTTEYFLKQTQSIRYGEKEITSVNEEYLKRGKLKVELLGRGMAWLDTVHIKAFLKRQTLSKPYKKTGLYIACLENSYLKGYITKVIIKNIRDPKKQITASPS